MSHCTFYWGSHGCDLERDHDGDVHRCGTHAEFRVDTDAPPMAGFNDQEYVVGHVRYTLTDDLIDSEWSEWLASEGWYGN